MTQDNLFINLHRWAARQDENYLTESLVNVCRILLERCPRIGAEAVNFLTGGLFPADATEAAKYDLRTQISTDDGRPDLEIVSREYRAFIEVKSESPVRPEQLQGYRRQLATDGKRQTRLVLLTRHPPGTLPADVEPDWRLRWHQVAGQAAEWAARSADPVCSYICEQFVAFLRDRNMHQAPVGWELLNGVRCLRTFLDMLSEAITGLGWRPRPSMSLNAFGCYLTVNEACTFWVGITHADPNWLEFVTDRTPIDIERAAQLGRGEVTDGKWQHFADLAGEDVYFFCRSASSQLSWLEGFIKTNVETALTLVTIK